MGLADGTAKASRYDGASWGLRRGPGRENFVGEGVFLALGG